MHLFVEHRELRVSRVERSMSKTHGPVFHAIFASTSNKPYVKSSTLLLANDYVVLGSELISALNSQHTIDPLQKD